MRKWVWLGVVRFNNRANSRPGQKDWRDSFHWGLAGLVRWLLKEYQMKSVNKYVLGSGFGLTLMGFGGMIATPAHDLTNGFLLASGLVLIFVVLFHAISS